MGNLLATRGSSVPVGKAANLSKLADGIRVNVVKAAGPFTDPVAGEVETALVTEFWKEKRVVLHMLRSSLAPVLEKHGVRLVGVGLGYNSLDGFMESKVWEGQELYVDDGKKLYAALGLGQGGLRMLADPQVLAANQKAKAHGVGGNLKGDGMQLGGTYVVDKGGEVILEFQQEKFGDHPTRESILEALGIDLSELPPAPEPPSK